MKKQNLDVVYGCPLIFWRATAPFIKGETCVQISSSFKMKSGTDLGVYFAYDEIFYNIF